MRGQGWNLSPSAPKTLWVPLHHSRNPSPSLLYLYIYAFSFFLLSIKYPLFCWLYYSFEDKFLEFRWTLLHVRFLFNYFSLKYALLTPFLDPCCSSFCTFFTWYFISQLHIWNHKSLQNAAYFFQTRFDMHYFIS